jgi:hypothetical protein
MASRLMIMRTMTSSSRENPLDLVPIILLDPSN